VKNTAAIPTVKSQKSVKESASGVWKLVVGSYLLEDALSADMVRVRKAGLEAAVEPGEKKNTLMNRLLLGEYDNRVVLQDNFEKLKRYTSDAFIIEHGGKFSLYAGSYLLDSRAASEKERLGAAGFQLSLKRTEVAVSTRRLTAGKFNDKKAAEAALKKLKDAGINASLSKS
jgi:cell division protein FtsN